jgi:hypothetical protein
MNCAVCFLLGHTIVNRAALWYMAATFLPEDVEAICLRCGHRISFSMKMADIIFSESPLAKSLREK